VAISLARQPGEAGVWLSHDAGRTWDHATAARDEEGRRVGLYDVALTPEGSLIVTGNDDHGAPGVWLGTSDVDSFRRLRLALREHVTLARPPLDRPFAIWATAPQAIWESDDEGKTWYLRASHLTWDHVTVVS
jgi:photosystem II stability/assembly factor-like uncharacterized protein